MDDACVHRHMRKKLVWRFRDVMPLLVETTLFALLSRSQTTNRCIAGKKTLSFSLLGFFIIMPGVNCSIYGCSTSRKSKGIAILRVPTGDDDYSTQDRQKIVLGCEPIAGC